MELDWSEQSPQIRTLYHPWQPGDGYDEATLQAAEVRLGVRLPAMLWNFYQAWGRRQDLTEMHHFLLAPSELMIRADALIMCAENQASWYWAVPYEMLEETNPPVVVGGAGPERSVEELRSGKAWRPSHAHLSEFLDDLTYQHAFAGGAVHGGHTDLFLRPTEHQVAWLERHWRKAKVTPMGFGLTSDLGAEFGRFTLYVRDGQALYWFLGCHIAVREAEALDEIGQALQINWAERR